MSLKRRSYEAGHKPKYLVIIDDSPECDRAVYYASRRAARTGASVVMLLVIEPHDRHQQWLGVADIMKAEAHEAADQKLDAFAARANGVAGITPERVIRDLQRHVGTRPVGCANRKKACQPPNQCGSRRTRSPSVIVRPFARSEIKTVEIGATVSFRAFASSPITPRDSPIATAIPAPSDPLARE